MSVGGEARGEDERIVQPYMTIESVASLPPNLLVHEPRRHTYTPAARGACVPPPRCAMAIPKSVLVGHYPTTLRLSRVSRRRGSYVLASSGKRSPFASVEGAVRFLAQVLSAGDMFGTTSGGSGFRDGLGVSDDVSAGASDADGAKVELRGWKWVKVSADASTRIDVATVCDAPLDAYLRLPAEEYALLDPKFVSRTSPTTFTFAVPLKSTLPAETSEGPASVLRELTPSIDFTTETDVARQTVTLVGAGASLGQADLDRRFELDLRVKLSWEGLVEDGGDGADGVRVGVVVSSDEEDGDASDATVAPRAGPFEEAEFSDAEDERPRHIERDLDVPTASTWALGCDAKLRMRTQVPRPLSLAPSFMLSGALSMIASAVAQALMPRLAEFLVADYERWAKGEERTGAVGSFEEKKRASKNDHGKGKTHGEGEGET